MRFAGLSSSLVRLLVILCATAAMAFSGGPAKLESGKADLKSASALAFGPDGVLFVGDSMSASIFALDTGDRNSAGPSTGVHVKGINQKIASLLGTAPDQILIQDVVVNPLSRNVYVAVSRGRGPDAIPFIARVDQSGKITELALDNIPHSRVQLPDPPGTAVNARGQSPRMEAITHLAFVEGNVLVAGLSNEEFSSSLRSIPYPFQQAAKAASIEIFHGSHGRFETNAPVRTFVPIKIDNEQQILAAYTCTPLVKIPVSELKPGNKVKGTTIAELGNRNRPLDMIVYNKAGHDYILMANSSRGVMKLPAERLGTYKAITAHTETAGVPYETVTSLKGVQQLDKFDDSSALLLTDDAGSLDLQTVPLP